MAGLPLLTVFTVLVAVRLAQGRRPPCACFGRLSTRSVGAGTIVRNVVLIGLRQVSLMGSVSYLADEKMPRFAASRRSGRTTACAATIFAGMPPIGASPIAVARVPSATTSPVRGTTCGSLKPDVT